MCMHFLIYSWSSVHEHAQNWVLHSMCRCMCMYLPSGWLRVGGRDGEGVGDDDSPLDFVNGDVKLSLVSERPAQVATGRLTSLALKRKQRKMHRKKVPSLICKATAWHIRNLYAQLTTGRLIFPLSLAIYTTLSLPLALDQTEWAGAITLDRSETQYIACLWSLMYFTCTLTAVS